MYFLFQNFLIIDFSNFSNYRFCYLYLFLFFFLLLIQLLLLQNYLLNIIRIINNYVFFNRKKIFIKLSFLVQFQ